MKIKPVVELWDTWNIRVLVITSLLTQVILSLLSQHRRQRGGKWFIRIPVWMIYLFADWVSIFAIGRILHVEKSTDFQTLWAPFLLLHLGGPDSITSFSLEDNEFWLRHLFGLLLQLGSTLYLFGKSLTHSMFWFPTFLVLIAGTIKYAERNLSFYFASKDRFGDNGVDSNSPSESDSKTSSNKLSWKEKIGYWVFCKPYPVQFHVRGADDSYLEEGWRYVRNGTLLSSFFMRREPYRGTMKFLWVGPLISPHRRDLSRICFLRKSSEDILHMIEIELSLLYEALHTKFPLFESKLGIILRVVGLSCISVASLSFTVLVNKHGGEKDSDSWKLDACLTYALLIGAITIDFISIILASFSDFHKFQPYWKFEKYLKIKNMCNDQAHDENVLTINRRQYWSREVPQLSFVKYYVDAAGHTFWSNKFADFPNLRITYADILRRQKYLSSEKLLENQVFWNFIVQELKGKAEHADTVEEGKKLCQRKGEGPILRWFNADDEQELQEQNQSTETKLIWRFWNTLEYTESFLAWHIATELCSLYEEKDPSTTEDRSISKVISCYMFYLFEMQDPLTTGVFIDSKALREGTCNHMQSALEKYKGSQSLPKPEDSGTGIQQYKEAADLYKIKNMYERDRDVHAEKGVSGKLFAIDKHYFAETAPPKTALQNARKLVDELKQEAGNGAFPWKLVSQVWVEIMCYAAINCRSDIHMQQPSQGGQLLTFVWLLMNNLGLGTNFSNDST